MTNELLTRAKKAAQAYATLHLHFVDLLHHNYTLLIRYLREHNVHEYLRFKNFLKPRTDLVGYRDDHRQYLKGLLKNSSDTHLKDLITQIEDLWRTLYDKTPAESLEKWL